MIKSGSEVLEVLEIWESLFGSMAPGPGPGRGPGAGGPPFVAGAEVTESESELAPPSESLLEEECGMVPSTNSPSVARQ